MTEFNITELVKQIIFYSVINSFVVFGIIKTIKKITEKEKLNRFIGLGITYAIGIIMGFMIWSDVPIWQKIMYGIFVGSNSVAVYESATKALLSLIPNIVARFFEPTKASENKPEIQ